VVRLEDAPRRIEERLTHVVHVPDEDPRVVVEGHVRAEPCSDGPRERYRERRVGERVEDEGPRREPRVPRGPAGGSGSSPPTRGCSAHRQACFPSACPAATPAGRSTG